jgi:phage-related protein
LSGIFGWVINSLQVAWNGIVGGFNWIGEKVSGIGSAISNAWSGFTGWLGGVGEVLGLGGIINEVSQAMGGFVSGIQGAASAVGGFFVDTISQGASAIGSAIQGAADAISGFIHALTGRNPGVIMHLEEFGSILKRISAPIAGVRESWNVVARGASLIAERVFEAWMTIEGVITGIFGNLMEVTGSLITGNLTSIPEAISRVTGALQDAAGAVKLFIYALTGRNPGVIAGLEKLGSALRNTTLLANRAEVAVVEAEGEYYGSRLIDLVSELISEVRELRREVSRLKPEVNVSVKTYESAYIRR